MSFGIEVYDQNGNVQFELGKKYFGSTGEIVIPITSTTQYLRSLSTTLTIPAQTGFKLWAMNSPASACHVEYISETAVVVHRYTFFAGGGNYITRPVTIYFGIFI